MVFTPMIVDSNRFRIVDYPQIDSFKSSSLLYSPSVNYMSNPMTIFRIFPFTIWAIIISFYFIFVILNTIKCDSVNKVSPVILALDYFAVFWTESKTRKIYQLMPIDLFSTQVWKIRDICGGLHIPFGY